MQDRAQILIRAVDDTRGAFDSIRGNFAKLAEQAGSLKGLLTGLGVSLSASSFVAMVKGAIDAADELNKLSQKIGISVESLSTLHFAAQLSDVSLETLQKGIKGLSQTIVEAGSGVGDGAAVFQALGIAVKNADGTLASTESVLLQVADVFALLEDGAVKTALAVKLFGKSGMEMIPFLNQGAAGITQLTSEAERLGLKLDTETARVAENFNDNLTALKASSSALGISLAKDLLPELTNITTAMRTAAKDGGKLKALWVGLGGVGNLIFNDSEIKQATDEVKRLQDLVDATRKRIESERLPVPFLPFDVKLNEGAMATLRKNLAQWEKELAGAQERLRALTEPIHPEENAPTGKPSEDMQRIACVVSGGQWINGQCVKKTDLGNQKDKDTTGARLALVKASAEAEFKVLKENLSLAQKAYDRALDDQLISIRDFYAAKTAIEQQAIDAELAAKEKERKEQSATAVGSTDESQRLRAKAEVKKLGAEITILNQQRTGVEVANAHAAAQAEKDLAKELEKVRNRLAELRGGAGGDVTRAQLKQDYEPLIKRLAAAGNAQGRVDVGKLIDVESNLAELARLERQYNATMERMRIAEADLQVKRDAGMVTESQMRREVIDLHQQTAREVDGLIPKMRQLAEATGSDDAVNRVGRMVVEVKGLANAVDDVAQRVNGATEDSFVDMFEAIGTGAKSAKDAFADFARSVLSAINRIAAQKLAEILFGAAGGGSGNGGLGGFIAALFSGGFATGGLVTGPGTSTSDSIPARLSHGEYVVNAHAVSRLGVAFLDAINGLSIGPRLSAGHLTFAAGGLVPQAPTPPSTSQNIRIVNVIDPAMAADYLNSSAGERTVMNLIQRNATAVRNIVGH